MRWEIGDECWGDLEELAQLMIRWREFIDAYRKRETLSLPLFGSTMSQKGVRKVELNNEKAQKKLQQSRI